MPSDKPLAMDQHVPDGYIMQPHGLGLVKLSSSMPALADKATSNKSDQGRYSLRQPRFPNVTTQGQLLFNTTKPVPIDKHYPVGKDPSANISSSAIAEDGFMSVSLHTSELSRLATSTDINTSRPIIAEREEPSQKRRRTVNEGTPVDVLAVEQSKHRDGEEKRVLKKNQPPYQQYTSVAWGKTPFPEHVHLSETDCEKIFEILKSHHASSKLNFKRPSKVPPPSLEVAGCGETQLLLDALARTCLSGATNMKNADNTIKKVVEYYGTINKSAILGGEEVHPVANCIDWDRVRREGIARFEEVIRCGGLQKTGSRAVLGILNSTHLENAERVTSFKDERATGVPARVSGTEKMTQEQKDMEIWMFDNGVISLEHLRNLPAETAMNKLVQFHGVGVKTAACVLLFCLQEDCFAVDTHCFRLASWLGWIPAHLKCDSGRDKAFAHLNLRIPDHLKYGLHQLFIEHGQNCYRCKANAVQSSKQWGECECPLEALLKRKKNTPRSDSAARKRKQKAAATGGAEGNGEVDGIDDLDWDGSNITGEDLDPELDGNGRIRSSRAHNIVKHASPKSQGKRNAEADNEFKYVAQWCTRKPKKDDDEEGFVPSHSAHDGWHRESITQHGYLPDPTADLHIDRPNQHQGRRQ